jgi:hypothetical protein
MFRADAEPKIYRLYNERLNLTYYGSTIRPIERRFNNHKVALKGGQYTSKLLFEEGDDVTCDVIEYVDCLDKATLLKRERYYIENFDCVNKFIPTRTGSEYYRDNKERIKEYHYENKEKRNEKCREYYKNNKDKNKQYRDDNKEKIRERETQKIECECGSVVMRGDIAKHRKTKKHQKFMIK